MTLRITSDMARSAKIKIPGEQNLSENSLDDVPVKQAG
jgi:hypothetical protein